MDLTRALRYMFLDPTWVQRAIFAIAVLVLPGIVGALAFELLDAFYGVPILVVASLIQIAATIFLYYRYYRITVNIVMEGRDLPLPGPEPLLDTGERAFMLILFGFVLGLTMIPVMCILLCPVFVIGASFSTNGAFLATVLWSFVVTFTIGLVFLTYQLVGQTRYLITRDFGGSLNPTNVFRLFQGSPGSWLVAAVFPVSISFASTVIQLILGLLMPDANWFNTAISVAITTPLGIYAVLVGFHLAGQAFRLSQPPMVPARPF